MSADSHTVSTLLFISSIHDAQTEAISQHLKQAGYLVKDVVDNNIESIQHCLNSSHNLVLLDHSTAPQLIEALNNQADHLSQQVAKIVFVPQGSEYIATAAIKAGADDYIIKDQAGHYLELLLLVIEKALANKKLEQQQREVVQTVQEHNGVLTLLNKISNELTSTLDTDKIIQQLMDSTLEVVGAQGCSIWLWENEEQTHLVCQAVTDQVASPALKGVRVEAGQGVVGWVAVNNKSTVVQQTADGVRFLADVDVKINFQTQSLLAMPMRFRDRVIGVLEIVNKWKGNFNEDDSAVARALAASAAVAIENANLVEKLRQHTADLEERNAELDAFAHTVAHDIQNMLARVVGFAELLKMDLSSDQNDVPRSDMKKSAEYISNNSRKISKVVEALLMFAAVRQADVKLELVNMEHIVAEVLERLSDTIEQTEAIINLPDEWPAVYGYGPWIEEVWYNYISNALKYGGTPPEITVNTTRLEDGQIQFWVQDNGSGISAEEQQHLFAPFTQLKNKRKKGHGLGLSIVERIISKMGGKVGVDSNLDQGSRFFFILPMYLPQSVLAELEM